MQVHLHGNEARQHAVPNWLHIPLIEITTEGQVSCAVHFRLNTIGEIPHS